MARNTTTTATKRTGVLVANAHRGDIIFPRKGNAGVILPPLVLRSGSVTEIDPEEWKVRRSMKVVEAWLDRGVLTEVRSAREKIAVRDEKLGQAQIPDHLRTDEEEFAGENTGVKSKVRRKNQATVSVA